MTASNPALAVYNNALHLVHREGIDPRIAVEVEALTPGLLRSRLNDAIETLVDDVRQWNIQSRTEEAERKPLRSLQGAVKKRRRV
ncbi:hypothetical protein NE236_26410 [Actinoallomurus purpureus]|uniref:hypothetical protein n=1 Tax=Actinoallomurus purpureus TaxID=478114 RepID=UPI002093CF6A|nr:hypothetical protein [Actinoallomurus purpureus]MCO6008512.1 hypothetical protein [Actinoallomurus purpureus]